MHELQELVDVVTRNKVKSIRLLEPFGDQPPDMLHDFYARLANHEFTSDEEAAQFYGYKDASDRGYRKQRDKLRDRLYNCSVFIDVDNSQFDRPQKAFYICQKNLTIIRTLLGRYADNSAIDLIKKTIKLSDRFEFSEISLELYKHLRGFYAFKLGNKQKYISYNKIVKQLEQATSAENIAIEYYERLALEIVKKSIPSDKYFQVAEEFINATKDLGVKTYKFIYFRNVIKSNYYLHIKEYTQVIGVCDNAILALRSKKYVSDQFINNFYFIKLIAYTQVGDLQTGRILFKKCVDVFERGTVRWYNTYDQFFLLLCRTKEYNQLPLLYDTVVSSSSFEYQSPKRKDTWIMYKAIIYYLRLLKKITPSLNHIHTDFNLGKFVNSLSIYSMDKSGYNIPTLIIQTLIRIKRQSKDVFDNIDSIVEYAQRHLKKDTNFRSHYFFKMLLLVPKCNFDRGVIEGKAKPYLKKLESVPLSEAKQSFEIEIIPYETLWEYVLESLEN